MRRYLKDAIGRCVDDRLPGAHVLFAQFLDDLSTGSGAIAERAASDARFEFAHQFGRKAVWEEREWLRQVNPGHLPMTRGGVFAGRRKRAFAVGGRGPLYRPDAFERLQIAQAKLRHV